MFRYIIVNAMLDATIIIENTTIRSVWVLNFQLQTCSYLTRYVLKCSLCKCYGNLVLFHLLSGSVNGQRLARNKYAKLSLQDIGNIPAVPTL